MLFIKSEDMLKISEELLQFIWQHRLIKPGPLLSSRGNQITVIHQGILNRDSGPDFFNGQIEVQGLKLSGNIELHLKTSDWNKHRHQHDPAYDKIILHVVLHHDVDLAQNTDNGVEIVELASYIPREVLEVYQGLVSNKNNLPCGSSLENVSDLTFISWTERMSAERLQQKTDKIEQLLLLCHGDYTQLMYFLLLSNFGFKVNALPFEMLARLLPAQLLLRHSNNLPQLEALLLGCAGMLDEQLENSYLRSLQNEFVFLQKKYGLHPMKKELFKFSKMRPANFPALRLAQFAALIHKEPTILTAPLSFVSTEQIIKIIVAEPGSYWKNHYQTSGSVSGRELCLGRSSAEIIIINTFVPFYFYYGHKFAKEEYRKLALDLLEECRAEDNKKTRLFAAKKGKLKSATSSQGLIHLYDSYCEQKRCLECGIGVAILREPTLKYRHETPERPWL